MSTVPNRLDSRLRQLLFFCYYHGIISISSTAALDGKQYPQCKWRRAAMFSLTFHDTVLFGTFTYLFSISAKKFGAPRHRQTIIGRLRDFYAPSLVIASFQSVCFSLWLEDPDTSPGIGSLQRLNDCSVFLMLFVNYKPSSHRMLP